MQLRSVSRRVAVLAGLLVAARSLAQQEAIAPPVAGPGGHALAPTRASAPSYGTTDLTYVRVTGIEFFPPNGSDGYAGGFLLSRHPINGPLLVAPVHLPSGSIIDYLEIDFCDSLDPQDIQLFLEDCGPLGLVCDKVANVNSFGFPGCSAISTSGFHHQVSDTGSSFGLRALFGAVNNGNLLITGAIVGYGDCDVSGRPGRSLPASVRRGTVCVGYHRRLRERELLPRLCGHSWTDGRLPGEGARPPLAELSRAAGVPIRRRWHA